jgi:Ran GTPase-activating protein (RanGAP) involved in mRNA processing and transport
MAGKAKAKGGKKAAKKDDEPDESTEKLFKLYKKKCSELQCQTSKALMAKFLDDEVEDIDKIHIWDEIGWQGVKALMESLKQVDYQHCKSLRLWKTGCEDEGVRSIVDWLLTNSSVEMLELLENKITPLGCDFISRILHPQSPSSITILKLDHNNIGSEGMNFLSKGLTMNKNLSELSVTYCNIDADGARAIFEILIYTKSGLKRLNLTGNHLRNEGIIKVLRGASCAKVLEQFNIADNQFGEDDEVLQALKFCMKRNLTLGHYDLKFNAINDEGIKFLTEVLIEAEHVWDVEVSERVTQEILKEFKER